MLTNTEITLFSVIIAGGATLPILVVALAAYANWRRVR